MDNSIDHNSNSDRAKKAVAGSQAHLESGLTAPSAAGQAPDNSNVPNGPQGTQGAGMQEVATTPTTFKKSKGVQ